MSSSPRPQAYASYQNSSEAALINDLESSSKNIMNKARVLSQETQEHNHLLEQIDEEMGSTHEVFEHETQNIRDARALGENFCWMYTIIVIEVFVIVVLLQIGL